ncbi:MAG: LPS-assembly protein LptD [Spongiibacteraceae bacterium]|nr:LPS-assembly protein LptD [Spongiibacteraceae bacterium]MBN4055370.1 LPS-assembly protein LptD [bacterium AH-315-K03]
MVVKNNLLRSVFRRIISLGFAISPAIAIADVPQYSQQEWACQADQHGYWQCESRPSTPGAYPSVAQPAKKIPTTAPSSRWDWVPKEQLGENQPCKAGCDGAYVAPTPNWPDADKKPAGASVHADADQSSIENNIVTLSGDVNVTQGHRQLRADQVTLNQNNDELNASGNIEVREPDLLIRANDISIDTETGLGEFISGTFLQHESGARGQAKTIKRQSDTVLVLEDGKFTQCTPDDELWFLNAKNITLDTETGWGSAKHARLEIKGIPVFYSPYMTFPIDDRRKSGFLFPSFGSSGDSGFEVSTPYYLNLAQNYDATFSPRYISDRGTLSELELRHLSQFGTWAISGSLLKDDRLYNENDDGSPGSEDLSFIQQDRWLGNIRHSGQILGISTAIDYTKASDNDYFKDLSINSLDVKRQTHLNQQATLGYQLGHWRSELIAQEQQTIDDDVARQYKFVPRATLAYSGVSDSFKPALIAQAEFTDFQHDNSIDKGGTFETGRRIFSEAGLSFPMQWAAGFIIPTVKVRSIDVDMTEAKLGNSDNYSATTPLGTLDMGLVFERSLNIGSKRFTQTLEPRLFYLYSDYVAQNSPIFDASELTFSYSQLFRDTRFTGHDRLDDANQASAGITTRFIEDNSGREVVSASIGQIFYFKDRVIRINADPNGTNQLSNSYIATDIQFQPLDNLWITNTLLWDARQDYLQEGGMSMQYQTDNSTLLNIAYRYRREGSSGVSYSPLDMTFSPLDLNQTDISLALPLSERWKIFSRFQYDIEGDRSLEDMFGIAYEDCCWMVRLIYQSGIEDEFLNTTDELNNATVVEKDYVFVLEFQLKGLGGIGSKAASILEESILGYKDKP